MTIDEQCGKPVYTYVTDSDIYPECRRPKGHEGQCTSWYFHPEGGWGIRTTPRITNELLKDKDE